MHFDQQTLFTGFEGGPVLKPVLPPNKRNKRRIVDRQYSFFSQVDDLPIFPFPGSKREYINLFLGYKKYASLLSPFLGGGALELAADYPVKVVADADPALQAQWRLILAGQWGKVLRGLRLYQNQVASLISTPGYSHYQCLTPGSRRVEAKNDRLSLVFMQSMDALWDRLIQQIEAPANQLELAISALAIRKLGFKSVIRRGKGGQINIKWSLEKLASFAKFEGVQPLIKGNWKFCNDAFEAIDSFKDQGSIPSIAIIDPPYWLPWVQGVRNQMTPAYANHKPHDDETLRLGRDSLGQVAILPFVDRIVYCNYFSDRMNSAVEEIACRHNLAIEKHSLGALDRDGERLDFVWVLERVCSN